MNVGLTTWTDAGTRPEPCLLIVNSEDGAHAEVAHALDQFRGLAPDLCVLAPIAWRDWLRDSGVADERLLFAADSHGAALELNHFLGSAEALAWVQSRAFAIFAGTAPHSLYNEEVKIVFEQSVAVLLARGRFIAHTLPDDYFYVLDLPGLMVRLGRHVKTDEYLAASHALIADLHALWQANGSPAISDVPDFSDAAAILERRLGEPLLRFDEQSVIPIRHVDAGAAAAADLVGQLSALLHQRTDAYFERATAVAVRDDIIDRLHDAGEHPLRRGLRWLRRQVAQ